MSDLAIDIIAVDAATNVLQAVAGVFGELTQAISAWVSSAADAESQQAGLSALLASTGEAAGLTSGDINELAIKFRDLAGGSEQAVIAIEEVGIRSGQISATQMPQFIQAVLNLSKVMGTDGVTAAQQLARAQDDPVGAFTRLERQTGIYDLALKNNIATLVKHGDTAQATADIMDFVARATGGSAAAAADTLSGKWSILTGHFEDFANSLGEHLLPVLEHLLDVITPILDTVYQDFENTFIPLIDQASAWGEGIINALASGMAAAAQSVVNVINQLASIISGLMAPGSPPKFLPNLDKWGEEAINVYMGGWKNFDKSVFDELYKAIKAGLPTGEIQEYADATKALTQAQDDLNATTAHYDSLISPLSDKLKGIQLQQEQLNDANQIAALQAKIADTGYSASDKKGFALEIEAIKTKEQIDLLTNQKDTAVAADKAKVDAAQKDANALKTQIDLALEFSKQTNAGAAAAKGLGGALKGIGEAASGAAHALAEMDKGNKDVSTSSTGLKQASGSIGDTIDAFMRKIRQDADDLKQFFKPITDGLAEIKKSFNDSIPDIQKGWDTFTGSLKTELALAFPQLSKDMSRIVADVGQGLDLMAALWRKHHDLVIGLAVSTLTLSGAATVVGFIFLAGVTATGLDLVSGHWASAKDDVTGTGVAMWNVILSLFGTNFDTLKKNVDGALDQLKTAFDDAFQWISDHVGSFISGMMTSIDNLILTVKTALSLLGELNSTPTAGSGGETDKTQGAASGGSFTIPSGFYENFPVGPFRASSGETVTITPNGNSAPAGTTINIDARGATDPSAVEQAVTRALRAAGYRSDTLRRMGTAGA